MKIYLVSYLIEARNKKEAIDMVRKSIQTICGCHAVRCYAGKGEKAIKK